MKGSPVVHISQSRTDLTDKFFESSIKLSYLKSLWMRETYSDSEIFLFNHFITKFISGISEVLEFLYLFDQP